MEHLVVKDDVIVNVILWDGEAEWTPPEGYSVESRTGEEWIGWVRVGGKWVNPESTE